VPLDIFECRNLTREDPGGVLVAEELASARMGRAKCPLDAVVKVHKDDPVEAAG
jgi:hypothetical protein